MKKNNEKRNRKENIYIFANINVRFKKRILTTKTRRI